MTNSILLIIDDHAIIVPQDTTILNVATNIAIVYILLILMGCTSTTVTPVSIADNIEQPQPEVVEAPPTLTRIPFPSPTSSPTSLLLLTPVPKLTTTPIPHLIVAPQTEVVVAVLNIREGPGVGYAIIDVAKAGDLFDVVGVNTLGDWLQVTTENGVLGWVSGQAPYTRLLVPNLDDVPVVQSLSPLSPASVNVSESGVNSKGKLIFTTSSGGDLYSVNADGSRLRHLTGGVIDPVASPDGQQVAFTRWDGAEYGVLYTINIDGSGERAIVGDILQPKSPAWSPDGQKIVLSFQYGGVRNPEKECRHFERGQQIRIPDNLSDITSFRISGDGSVNVCFIRREELLWRLRQVEVQTGAFEDLSSDEYSYNPTWDPKNPWRVIYDGYEGLIQVDVTNGQQWPITDNMRDTGPVFSPDGTSLALTYKQHDHWEVYTYHLETGVRQRLTKPPILADPQYNSAAPAWSPNGSEIAFITDRNGPWEVWVMNVDGSNQRPLFMADIQAQFDLVYHGVNERMLSWVD